MTGIEDHWITKGWPGAADIATMIADPAGAIFPLSLLQGSGGTDRYRLRITDSGHGDGTTATDGVHYLGFTLDFEQKRGVKRLHSALRG